MLAKHLRIGGYYSKIFRRSINLEEVISKLRHVGINLPGLVTELGLFHNRYVSKLAGHCYKLATELVGILVGTYNPCI